MDGIENVYLLVSRLSPRDAVLLIQEILTARFGIVDREIGEATSLESLGVDSLAGLEILFEIEERIGSRLPSSLISRQMTVGELAESLAKTLAEQAA